MVTLRSATVEMRPADERALRLAPARAGERRRLGRDHYGLLLISSVVGAGREVDAHYFVVALLDFSSLSLVRRRAE